VLDQNNRKNFTKSSNAKFKYKSLQTNKKKIKFIKRKSSKMSSLNINSESTETGCNELVFFKQELKIINKGITEKEQYNLIIEKEYFKNEPFNDSAHLSILVIDDDALCLLHYKNLLETIFKSQNLKFSIITALDAIEALSIIRDFKINHKIKFNLIFIDENMPYIKGTEFIKLYKSFISQNEFYEVPFISISTDFTSFEKEKALHYFSNLNKPCSKLELSTLLNKLFAFS
jgi:CheY-like chemotaxis protein